MKRFPQFTRFPAELRRQIWQDTCPLPGFHAFDVCIPSTSEESRLSQATRLHETATEDEGLPSRIKKYRDTVFLDQFMPAAEIKPNQRKGIRKFETDPSAYHITTSVRQSCFEALESLRTRSEATNPKQILPNTSKNPTNNVYLPTRDQWIKYDNMNDVLFLRFGDPVSLPASLLDEHEEEEGYVRTFSSGLSEMLLCPWSEEFTETLRTARRVALDLSELEVTADTPEAEEAVAQDIAYLACCLQNELEVLYVIVSSVEGVEGGGLDAVSLQMMGNVGRVLCAPGFEKRGPDVFYGKGATCHEVFAWERLGLGEETREFWVLKMLADAVREQQGEQGVFRGVRALVCQRDQSACSL
ncbi:hypothetical protein BJX64DRAFT_290050 [Aspergillus heterothallicus]